MFAAILAVETLSAPGAWAAGRVALVVGVSGYEKITPLVNPAQDAKLMQETLQKLGFTVTMLSDGHLMRLGKDDFRSLLNEPFLEWMDYVTAKRSVTNG